MSEISIEKLEKRLEELYEEEIYKINKISSKYKRDTPFDDMKEKDIKEIKGIMKWYKHMRDNIHSLIQKKIEEEKNDKKMEDSDTSSEFTDHNKSNTNTVTLDLDRYNEIIEKANKYDELEANGEAGTDLDIHIGMTMRSVEDMLDGDKLIHNIHEKRKR